eukprot:EG_transcript_35870
MADLPLGQLQRAGRPLHPAPSHFVTPVTREAPACPEGSRAPPCKPASAQYAFLPPSICPPTPCSVAEIGLDSGGPRCFLVSVTLRNTLTTCDMQCFNIGQTHICTDSHSAVIHVSVSVAAWHFLLSYSDESLLIQEAVG